MPSPSPPEPLTPWSRCPSVHVVDVGAPVGRASKSRAREPGRSGLISRSRPLRRASRRGSFRATVFVASLAVLDGDIVALAGAPLAVAARSDGIWALHRDSLVDHDRRGEGAPQAGAIGDLAGRWHRRRRVAGRQRSGVAGQSRRRRPGVVSVARSVHLVRDRRHTVRARSRRRALADMSIARRCEDEPRACRRAGPTRASSHARGGANDHAAGHDRAGAPRRRARRGMDPAGRRGRYRQCWLRPRGRCPRMSPIHSIAVRGDGAIVVAGSGPAGAALIELRTAAR